MASADKWVISLDLDTSGLTRGLSQIRGQLDALGRPSGFSGAGTSTYISAGEQAYGAVGPAGYAGGTPDTGLRDAIAAQGLISASIQQQISQLRTVSSVSRNSGFAGSIGVGGPIIDLPGSKAVERQLSDIAGSTRTQAGLAKQYTGMLERTVNNQQQIARSQQEIIAANRYAAASIRRRVDSAYNQVLAIAQPVQQPAPLPAVATPVSRPLPLPSQSGDRSGFTPVVVAPPPARALAQSARAATLSQTNRPYADNANRLAAAENSLLGALNAKSQALQSQTNIVSSNLGRFAAAENDLIAALEAKAAAVQSSIPSLPAAAATNALASGTIPLGVAAGNVARAIGPAPISQSIATRPQYERVRPEYIDSPTQGRVFQRQIDTEKIWDQFVEQSRRFQPQVAQSLNRFLTPDIAGASVSQKIGSLIPNFNFRGIEPTTADRFRYASSRALEFHPFLADRFQKIGSFSQLGINSNAKGVTTNPGNGRAIVGFNDALGTGSLTDQVLAKLYGAGLAPSPNITKTAYHEIAGHHLDFAALERNKAQYSAGVSRVLGRYGATSGNLEDLISSALGPYAARRNDKGRLSELIPEAVANVYTAPKVQPLALDLYQAVHGLVDPRVPSTGQIEQRRRLISQGDASLSRDIAGARLGRYTPQSLDISRPGKLQDGGNDRYGYRWVAEWQLEELRNTGQLTPHFEGRSGTGSDQPVTYVAPRPALSYAAVAGNDYLMQIDRRGLPTAGVNQIPGNIPGSAVRVASIPSISDRVALARQVQRSDYIDDIAGARTRINIRDFKDLPSRAFTELGSGSEATAFQFTDPNTGRDLVARRFFNDITERIDRVQGLIQARGIPGAEQFVGWGNNRLYTELLPGRDLFNSSYIDPSFNQAKAYLTTLGRLGLAGNRHDSFDGNTLYDSSHGFSAIDFYAQSYDPKRVIAQRNVQDGARNLQSWLPLKADPSDEYYKILDYARAIEGNPGPFIKDIAGARYQNRSRNRELLGSGVDATAYGFTGPFGQQLVERIFDEALPTRLIERRVEGLRRAADVPRTEQLVSAQGRDVITTRLPGKDLWNPLGINPTLLQISELVDTLKQLGSRGVSIDAGAGNFLYEPQRGFGVIDFAPTNINTGIATRQNVESGLNTVRTSLTRNPQVDPAAIYELESAALRDIAGARYNQRNIREFDLDGGGNYPALQRLLPYQGGYLEAQVFAIPHGSDLPNKLTSSVPELRPSLLSNTSNVLTDGLLQTKTPLDARINSIVDRSVLDQVVRDIQNGNDSLTSVGSDAIVRRLRNQASADFDLTGVNAARLYRGTNVPARLGKVDASVGNKWLPDVASSWTSPEFLNDIAKVFASFRPSSRSDLGERLDFPVILSGNIPKESILSYDRYGNQGSQAFRQIGDAPNLAVPGREVLVNANPNGLKYFLPNDFQQELQSFVSAARVWRNQLENTGADALLRPKITGSGPLVVPPVPTTPAEIAAFWGNTPDIAGARRSVRQGLAGTNVRAEDLLDASMRDFFNPDEIKEVLGAVENLAQRAPALFRRIIRSQEEFWNDTEAQAQVLSQYTSGDPAAVLGERGGVISPLVQAGQRDLQGRLSTAENTLAGRLLAGDRVANRADVGQLAGATFGVSAIPFATTLNPEILRLGETPVQAGVVNPTLAGITSHELTHFAAGGNGLGGVPEVLAGVRKVMTDFGLFETPSGAIGGNAHLLPSPLAFQDIGELISESNAAELTGVGSSPFTAAVFGAVNEGLLQSEDREKVAVDQLTVAAQQAAAALEYLATATAAQVRALGVPQSVAQTIAASRPTSVEALGQLSGVGPARQAAILENAAKAQLALGGGTPPPPPTIPPIGLPAGSLPPPRGLRPEEIARRRAAIRSAIEDPGYVPTQPPRLFTSPSIGGLGPVTASSGDWLRRRTLARANDSAAGTYSSGRSTVLGSPLDAERQAALDRNLQRAAARRQQDAEAGPLGAGEARYRRRVSAAQRAIELNDISGLNNATQDALFRGFRPVQPGRGIESEIWQEASSSRSGSTKRAEALRSQLRGERFAADPKLFSGYAQAASVLEDQLAAGAFSGDPRAARQAQRAAASARSQFGLTNQDVQFGRYQLYESVAAAAGAGGKPPPPPPPGYNDWAAAGSPTPGSGNGGSGGRGVGGGAPYSGDRGGGWFSRFRQGIRSDSGLGGFFGQGALSVVKYGLPSMALYGAASGLTNSLREAEEFQYNIARMESQLEALGDSGTTNIDAVKDSILDLARNTGVAADQITEMQLRIRGAFAGETIGGLSGEALVSSQTEAAAKLAVVTKLDPTAVNNDLTAASLGFDVTFEQLGNIVTKLEAESGVPSGELVNFLGDVAPVAADAGFSAEQISSIGSLVLQRSGRSGTALAEAFNRILPAVNQNKPQLLELAGQEESLRTPEFIDAVRSGDVATVITSLSQNFEGLNKQSKDFVINLLGGRREAQALIPAFSNSARLSEFMKEASDSAGSLDERFNKLRETLTNTLSRLGEQVRTITVLLLEAGLTEVFETALATVGLLVGGITALITPISAFNDALGGIPARLLSILALFKLLQFTTGKFSTSGSVISGLFGGVGPRGGKGFSVGDARTPFVVGSNGVVTGGTSLNRFAGGAAGIGSDIRNFAARQWAPTAAAWSRFQIPPLPVFGLDTQNLDPARALPAGPQPIAIQSGASRLNSRFAAVRASLAARASGFLGEYRGLRAPNEFTTQRLAFPRNEVPYTTPGSGRVSSALGAFGATSPSVQEYRRLRAPNEFVTRRLGFPRNEVGYTTPGLSRSAAAFRVANNLNPLSGITSIPGGIRDIAATRGVSYGTAFRGVVRSSLPSVPALPQAGAAFAAGSRVVSGVSTGLRGVAGVGVSALGSGAAFLAANPFMGILALAAVYAGVNAQIGKAKEELDTLAREIQEGNQKAFDLQNAGDETAVAMRYISLGSDAIDAFESQGWWDRGWRTIFDVESEGELIAGQREALLLDPQQREVLNAVAGTGLEERGARLAFGRTDRRSSGRQTIAEFRRGQSELADFGQFFTTGKGGASGVAQDLFGTGGFVQSFINANNPDFNGKKDALSIDYLESRGGEGGLSTEAVELGSKIIEAGTGSKDGELDATVFRAATRANRIEALQKIVDDANNTYGEQQQEQARNILEAIYSNGITDEEFSGAAFELEDASDPEAALTQNLQTLASLQESGYLSIEEYARRGRLALSERASAIFGGNKEAATDEEIAAFLKDQADFNARIGAIRQKEVQQTLEEYQAFGVDDSELSLRTIDLNLQTLRDPEIQDPDTLRSAALSVIQASNSLYAELASRAGSADAAAKILEQGRNDPAVREAVDALNKSRIQGSSVYRGGAVLYQNLRKDPGSDLLDREIGPDAAFDIAYQDYMDDGVVSEDTVDFFQSQAREINDEYKAAAESGEPITGQQLENMRGSMKFLMAIMKLFGIATEEYDPELLKNLDIGDLPGFDLTPAQLQEAQEKELFTKRQQRTNLEGQRNAAFAALSGDDTAAAKAVFDAASKNLESFTDKEKFNDDGSETDEFIQAQITFAQTKKAWLDSQTSSAQAFTNLAVSQANLRRDSVGAATAQLQGANDRLAKAAPGSPEAAAAQADQNAAILAIQNAQTQRALAGYDLLAARGSQGGVNQALIARARAQEQLGRSVGDEVVGAEAELARAERAVRQAQDARVQALARVFQIGVKDSLQSSNIGLAAARINLDAVTREFGGDSAEYYDALAQVGEAEKAQRQSLTARIRALYDLKKSKTNDNLYDAVLDVDAAKQILAEARKGGDVDEIIDAERGLADAEAARRQALRSRIEGLFGLKKAGIRDPLQTSQLDIVMLNVLLGEAQRAGDIDAQIDIQTRLVSAQQAAADAMQDVRTSMFELRAAELNAMEDEVGAAQVARQQALSQLEYGISQGVGDAEINRLRASAITADKAARDAVFTDRYDEYKYMLEMNEISKSTYMDHIRNLQSTVIPGSKKFKELEMELKRLKDDMSSDLSVNLPSSLGLPTVYEIRRMNQQTSYNTVGGSTGYNDNRSLNINGTMINNGMDFQQFVDVLAQFMGVPGTSGSYTPHHRS